MTIRQKGLVFILCFFVLSAALLAVAKIMPAPGLTDNILYCRAFYSADGELLRISLSEDEKYRLYTPLSEISPVFIEATIFYEDRYFYYHPGVNPLALMRGFWSTYVTGQRVVGGSTITMQLARVLYDIDSTTISGKLNQIFHAFWIEMRYSKDEILEAYLNLAPYGHNIEGVGAASLIYFNKRAEGLTMLESFTLCVIPQNPVKRLPTSDAGFAELKEARDRLVQTWITVNPTDADRLDHFSLPMSVGRISDLPFKAPHFVNSVAFSYPEESEYFTTIELEKQEIVEDILHRYVAENAHIGVRNAAAILVDARTMNVVASVGSANFFNSNIYGQVDGTRAKRSPGSLLKPFIYALAIDEGQIHPLTLLKDAPVRYGLYSPENADRGFLGPIFAQNALNYSRNIPAVELLLGLSAGSFMELLIGSGIHMQHNEDYYGAALALGGFEISMEDAARLYTSLINGGRVSRLKKLAHEADSEPTALFSSEAAYITADMIKNNLSPLIYGYPHRFPVKAGYKTGTSYGFRDGWTAVILADYVLVVWVGNFDGEGNPAFMGRRTATPLAFRIIHHLIPSLRLRPDPVEIPGDLNVKLVDVCAVTGELPMDYCPEYVKTLFIPGVSPIKVSDIYRQIPVDIATGLRACRHDPETTRMEVYEFWPADILQLFERAGIKRKTPPRYMPGCTIEETAYTGVPPSITYPVEGVVYDLYNSPDEEPEIPLIASASADAENIFWFIDNRFLGTSPNGKPLYWRAEPGEHYLQAVDNLGRSASLIFVAE